MSEILGRTWSYLTSSGSGPKWSVPCNQSSSTAHLPHGLAQFMKAVLEAPTSVSEAELVKTQLNAIQMKLQEPNIKMAGEEYDQGEITKIISFHHWNKVGLY